MRGPYQHNGSIEACRKYLATVEPVAPIGERELRKRLNELSKDNFVQFGTVKMSSYLDQVESLCASAVQAARIDELNHVYIVNGSREQLFYMPDKKSKDMPIPLTKRLALLESHTDTTGGGTE